MLGNKNRITATSFRPIKENVFVTDLDSGPHLTAGGIIIPDDNGMERGIRPRWGRVWAVGPEVQGVEVGEWVFVEHGRWTLSIDLDLPDGVVRVWKVDWPEAVLLAAKTDPREWQQTAFKEVVHPQSEEHLVRSKAPIVKRFHS
jgi:hypothetical protein